MYTHLVKPTLDKLVAIIALIVASPLFLLLVLLLAIFQNGHVFFTQNRPGKDEIIFKLIKFKTMRDDVNESGELLPDKERLTWIGNFVRRTSMDEIPQLLNVIKGDMSFVGPRPLLVEYLPLYSAEQAKRHLVKPGISGWAQVNGRNAIGWQEKFSLDVWYVAHQNFLLDFKILFLTIAKVFKSEGISANGEVTIQKFKGN